MPVASPVARVERQRNLGRRCRMIGQPRISQRSIRATGLLHNQHNEPQRKGGFTPRVKPPFDSLAAAIALAVVAIGDQVYWGSVPTPTIWKTAMQPLASEPPP